MNTHHHIDYVEIPSDDLAATKAFFSTVFGMVFTDYGDDYTAFEGAGVTGGFFRSAVSARTDRGSALIVNLPGQPKAIGECLDAVMPAIPYCVDLIGGPFLTTDENHIKAFRPKRK